MKNKQLEKLWIISNKLRGAFEVTELYKVMLYGLLFKYLELKKEELNSFDEKFSLGYLSLLSGNCPEIISSYVLRKASSSSFPLFATRYTG